MLSLEGAGFKAVPPERGAAAAARLTKDISRHTLYFVRREEGFN
jgi:hypothetical protein